MKAVFTLASGRSGTHFLYELIRRNARDCAARHETYGWNPSLFGRPIYDYAVGDRQRTLDLLRRKVQAAERCGAGTYLETSHALLKSWADLVTDVFPNLQLIHVVRHPLQVAKSEAAREAWLRWLYFCHYRGGDGQKYFYWSLTGREPIFAELAGQRLTRLQWYVVQWIEIENRAMRLLDQFGLHTNCFTLESPSDLNNAERIQSLLAFLQLEQREATVSLAGRKNRNWRPTVLTSEDERQFGDVVSAVPPHYLSIFERAPYTAWGWAAALRR